jgi:hypothetical protein
MIPGGWSSKIVVNEIWRKKLGDKYNKLAKK